MEKNTQNYKDLIVWQKGISLAKAIYQLTTKSPAEEKFGLVSQMRRAAISIPSNIAEGQARHTTGDSPARPHMSHVTRHFPSHAPL